MARRNGLRIGILTGGGDAPGLNAAIRAVVRPALSAGDTVVGIRNGWAGLTGEGDFFEIERRAVSGVIQLGGTMLGSSRVNPKKLDDGMQLVQRNLARANVDALIAIGGDDTLGVAAWLSAAGVPVVGVPKTMDNDLSVTEYCIGFDSAVHIVTEALDRLHTTAASHHRVMVVEVMGRDTGWVAVEGGLAGGADFIVIPEFPATLAEITSHLEKRRAEGRDFSIIVVAEGVELDGVAAGPAHTDAFGHVQLSRRGVGERLADQIEQETSAETRATVLGHTQRGGSPTAFDRIWATRVGAYAYELVRQEKWGAMGAVRCGKVETVAISEVVATQRKVPRDLYDLAATFF